MTHAAGARAGTSVGGNTHLVSYARNVGDLSGGCVRPDDGFFQDGLLVLYRLPVALEQRIVVQPVSQAVTAGEINGGHRGGE